MNPFRRLLIALLCTQLLVLSGCVCSGDTEWLSINFKGTCWYNYDGPIPYYGSDFHVTFYYGDDETLPEGAAQLYFEGEPVELEATDEFMPRGADNGNCPHNQREYTNVEPLEPGVYTFVHRRDRGTGNPLNCAHGWHDYNGHQSFVVDIEIVERPEDSEPTDDDEDDSE